MSGVVEEVVVPNPHHNNRSNFEPRKTNRSHLGGKIGLAALSALTGGVLTWAAMAHGGLGATTTEPTPTHPVGAFHDGTFTGAGFEASGGPIVVHITVAGGVITAINADYPTEPAMSGDINRQYIPQLIDSSLAAQSANIANITNATVTTDAFKSSLQDAINQASGAGGGVVGAVPPTVEVTPAAPVSNLHDGVFFGEGYNSGPGGNTYVTMTVIDGRIAGISATYPIGNADSAAISAAAIPTLVTEAKDLQSSDITNITGSTNTSNAFKSSLQDAINQSAHGAPVAPALGNVADGTFVGNPASTGRAGDTVATVHIAGGRITEITGEYPDHEWGDMSNAIAIPQIIDAAVAHQSAGVDNVTGATNSSTAFKASLQSAINMARGGDAVAPPAAAALHDGVFFGEGVQSSPGGNTYVTMTVHDGAIVAISATYPIGNEESRQISHDAILTLVAEAKDIQGSNITNITGATNSSNAFKDSLQDAINQSQAGAAVAAPLGAVQDGTFTGNPASTGRAGDGVVTVTIAGGHITDIQTDFPDHEWGDHTNASTIEVLVNEVKESQSTQVNFVSGATNSSNAFIASLQSALNQARGQ